jgi:molybdopterin molybdotransferase
MISATEARNIILSSTTEFQSEIVSLLESHNRILASDVRANDDVPPFKNSSMDGYAIRSSDTLGSSTKTIVELKILGEVAAGEIAGIAVEPMHALRILTGAPLPRGADAVVPLEHVEERIGAIRISSPVAPGSSTRERGEDIKRGETVLLRGTRIDAAHVGVIASLGCTNVAVFRKPTMAILTTGNELLSVTESLRDGMIRNSNAHSLRALALENDCEPIDLGVARDNEEELLRKIREGLKYDLFVTSGGVSAGKYDYVLDSMKKAQVNLKFWKVNIKPGMPFAFGTYAKDGRDVLVFCLPGNPVSTVVTFLQFVQPCIQRMMSGSNNSTRMRLRAKLEQALSKSDGKRHYHRGIVRSEEGKLYVRSTGNQSSGVLSSLVKANCLITLNEQQSEFAEGEEVVVELLPWGRIE